MFGTGQFSLPNDRPAPRKAPGQVTVSSRTFRNGGADPTVRGVVKITHRPKQLLLSSALVLSTLTFACTGETSANCPNPTDPTCSQPPLGNGKPDPSTPPGETPPPNGEDPSTGTPPDDSGPGVDPIDPPGTDPNPDPGPDPKPDPEPEEPQEPGVRPGAGAGVGPTLDRTRYDRLLWVSPSGGDQQAGTEAQPLKTIARAISLATPGTGIVVRGGTYSERIRISGKDGRADAPYTLMGAPGERALVKGGNGNTSALLDVRSAYWRVVGMTFDVGGDRAFAAIWRDGGKHGELRKSELMNGTLGAGVTVALGGSDVLVEGNHIHHFRQEGDDSHGVLAQTTSARVVVRSNDIHTNSGDAIQCLGPEGSATVSGTPFDDLLIENNLLHGNDENGVDIKTCTNVTIRGNDVYDHKPTSRSRGEGIVIHLSAAHVYVEENRIWGNGRGISLGGVVQGNLPNDLVVRRNTVWGGINTNGGEASGIRVDSVTNAKVIHNTFHAMTGFCLSVGSGDNGNSTNITIQNNIFSDCGIAMKRGSRLSNVRVDSNLYHRASGSLTFQNGSNRSFSQWRSDTGWDAESLEAAPRFVNAAAADFRLQSGSPAIDRGTGVGEGACGQGPDIGAIESCN